MIHIETIEKLGLNKKQSSVYYTLLQLGSGTILDIAKKTKEKRTTVYSVLDSLTEKGFVTFKKIGAHREYYPEDPKKLVYLYDEEIIKINFRKKNALELLPELASIYNTQKTKPKIKYFEGIDGLKILLNETLTLGQNEEILAISSAESIHSYFGDDYVKTYLKNRVSKGITQRAIAEMSDSALMHQKNDRFELRETLLVDKDKFPFSNEINIFGNKICIISYRDQLGILIESAEISKTQKAVFELAWLGAKHLNTNLNN